MKARGFTLLELLLVLAMGGGLLTGVAYMLNLGMRAHNSGTAEAEARQTLEFALEQIGRAVRESQDVLVPNTVRLDRNETDPTKNVLAVSLSPVLDANADGYPDADNDRDGVVDWEARKYVTGQAPQFPLRDPFASPSEFPRDITNDSKAGIREVDDDGDGDVDENDPCWLMYGHDESTCNYNWDYDSSTDWLDAVVFKVQASGDTNVLVYRQPTPLGSNGQAWKSHVLARNVTAYTVKLVTTGVGAARALVEVKLCVAVASVNQAVSRAPVCAFRVWRVGGEA